MTKDFGEFEKEFLIPGTLLRYRKEIRSVYSWKIRKAIYVAGFTLHKQTRNSSEAPFHITAQPVNVYLPKLTRRLLQLHFTAI